MLLHCDGVVEVDVAGLSIQGKRLESFTKDWASEKNLDIGSKPS